MNQLASFLIIVLFIISCNSTDEQSKAKVDSLEKVIAQMNEELNGYRNNPSNLCANLSSLIETENLQKLQEIQKALQTYHPACQELKEVQKAIADIRKIQSERKAEEEAKRMVAVDALKKEFDDVRGNTWYYSKKLGAGYTHCFAYIGQNKSELWMRLRMQYHGSDWIFFEYAYLSYDGNTISLPFDMYREKKDDVSDGVWEWVDIKLGEEEIAFLRKMVNGKVAKWRLSGKYMKTYTFSANQIAGFKEILLAYDVLKSKN